MIQVTALTDLCGPHCVATRQDGRHLFVTHCETCHNISGTFVEQRRRHLAESEARTND